MDRSGECPLRSPSKQAQDSARRAAVAMLASLQRALGSLDRIAAWISVSGFVNAEDGYPQTTAVLNPFSTLILEVFDPQIGAHARTAIGVRALPLNLPLVVGAEKKGPAPESA